jgi:integrase
MASIRKRSWTSRGVKKERWVADYVDQTGARRLRTFPSKKAADAWLITARHEIRTGTHTAASASDTVTTCFERWIEHSEAEGLEFGTVRQRRQHLRLHVAPLVGREKLSELTAPRIHEFLDQLRDAGRSVAMRRKVLTNLKTAIGHAQSQGRVAQNVARGVRLKASDQRTSGGPLREGVDYPSRAELRRLIDAAPDKVRAFVITAIFTGIRISELRGLPWRDVDLDAGVLHIRQRADAWGRLGPPKSKAGSRDIPLVPMAVNALRQWRLACPAGDLGLVFPNRHGRVQTIQNLRERVLLPLQRSCGITAQYGFHALRHAAASLFIAYLGWTPKRVQTVMGHASITMTYDRYGHLFADTESDRKAMERLEAAVLTA